MEIAWENILGHEEQIARLRALRAEDRLPHALLFYGPEGVGKLRVAQVLAAELLCEGEGTRPCGVCRQCRSLLQDAHPDYYEIHPEGKTAKSTKMIKIETIRAMEADVERAPLQADQRVVVIDDAEKMNEAAENSLLKTLEEPKGAVHFILVTRARSSMLDTIRSRCMNVGFGGIPEMALAEALALHGIPKDAATELAALSDGSFGRALALYEGGGLTLRDDAAAFLMQLSSFTVKQVFERGTSMESWPREKLMEWFLYLGMLLRDLLVLTEDGASPLLYHKDLRERLAACLPAFPLPRIEALLVLVRAMNRRLLANVNQRLLLEGFFLRAMEA